ncbi:AAA family ATPase [Brumimicrobium oceani]|uniref:AAA family ATPase n=1 Tax=Brumimicrobium oceani TaxID=2100725 RepID=A0A2U2X0R6_9FLAO|nr:ATP-binding protein [Brumimicrobium oceani]PWH81359.1 AAA family ATPase [Brumimicrobium oceani]
MKIQEFSFGNYKSFKDIQTLNLSSANIKSSKPNLDVLNVIKGENKEAVSFLKSKAIYGANASGKSNIIKALVSFVRIIRTSVKDEKALNAVESFKLSTETENEPTFFQMIFWHNNIKFRYGFEADNEKIVSEWLYGKPKGRDLPFFIRDNQEVIKLDKTNYSEGNKLLTLLDDDSDENEVFRNNSLFLSTLATFGFGKLSKQIIDSLGSIIVVNGLGHQGMYRYAGDALNDLNKKKYIIDFLKYGDIGIEDLTAMEVSLEDLPDINERIRNVFEDNKKGKILVSTRKKYDENKVFNETHSFPFIGHESEGTKKLFELSPLIYDAINNQSPIFIDEFDARFHPLLTKKILELFNSESNIGSQLVFTTHDSNLLSPNLLRRDQIEFVEKDKYGASHLYSLAQFKGVRNTSSFEKDYIQGKYGAIPFLGDFRKLMKIKEDA